MHRMFGLDDETAAKVLLKLAKKIRVRANQYDTINSVEDCKEKVFAAFMVGLWNGISLARMHPNKADSELLFVTNIVTKIEKGEDALKYIKENINR